MKIILRQPDERAVMKITPHRQTLNSRSYKLMSALHDLFSVREKRVLMPWEHRKGLHVAIRNNPSFWWVVQMSHGAEGQKIEFFVSMPKSYVKAFLVKFRNHEQWRKATVEEVPTHDFDMPPMEDTLVQKYCYHNHDMFSLAVDHSEQTTPIRELLSVSDELAEGERIDMFIKCESVERTKWKSVAEFAWEIWGKGDVPYRAGIDPARIARKIYSAMNTVLYHLKSLMQDILTAMAMAFSNKKGMSADKEESPKEVNQDRELLLINGDLSQRTKSKRNKPVFSTAIRCAVHSPDSVKREMLARSVGNAIDSLSGDNRLVAVNIRGKKELERLSRWEMFDHDKNLMSVEEVGKLMQLPTADVQDDFADAINANRRVEIEIPKAFLDDSGILAGISSDKGVSHNVHIPTKNLDFLFTPRIVCGSPRMGKDQHIINMIVEAKLKHNIGAVIPDVIDERNGHRGMADAIRDHLPPEDVIDIDLGNVSHSPYIGLNGVFRNIKDTRVLADRIGEEMVDFLLQDGEVESMMQTADFLREAAKVTMGDPLAMKLMFLSKEYRQEKIEELDDTYDMDIWKDYDRMTDGKQGQIFGPIMRRLGQIINSEYLKPIFCQPPSESMDIHRWIDEGKIVIFRVRMPDGVPMSERIKQILVYWIVLQTFMVKLSLGGKSQAKGTMIVLNEPHQYLSDGLVRFMERMLSEAPKYRLAPVMAFHDFSQFKSHQGFVDMLLASSVNWHLFKNTNHKTYEKLMPYLSKTFPDVQTAFESTKAYQFIACWLHQGEYMPPFVCDALPMVGKRYTTSDNSELTTRHVTDFGRPTNEVLAYIRQRNKMTFQTA